MTFTAKVKKNVKIVMTNLEDKVLKTEKALACHICIIILFIIPQVLITSNPISEIICSFSSIAILCILQLPLYGVV